jgi:hypothetical protein
MINPAKFESAGRGLNKQGKVEYTEQFDRKLKKFK